MSFTVKLSCRSYQRRKLHEQRVQKTKLWNSRTWRRSGPGMRMGMPVEKAKNFKGTLKRLITYLKPYKLQLLFVLLAAIMSTIFAIVSPKIMGKATTKLFEGVMMKLKGVPGATIDFGYIGNIVLLLNWSLYNKCCLFIYSTIYYGRCCAKNGLSFAQGSSR